MVWEMLMAGIFRKVVKGKVLKEDKARYLLLFSDVLVVCKVKEKKSRRAQSSSSKDSGTFR